MEPFLLSLTRAPHQASQGTITPRAWLAEMLLRRGHCSRVYVLLHSRNSLYFLCTYGCVPDGDPAAARHRALPAHPDLLHRDLVAVVSDRVANEKSEEARDGLELLWATLTGLADCCLGHDLGDRILSDVLRVGFALYRRARREGRSAHRPVCERDDAFHPGPRRCRAAQSLD